MNMHACPSRQVVISGSSVSRMVTTETLKHSHTDMGNKLKGKLIKCLSVVEQQASGTEEWIWSQILQVLCNYNRKIFFLSLFFINVLMMVMEVFHHRLKVISQTNFVLICSDKRTKTMPKNIASQHNRASGFTFNLPPIIADWSLTVLPSKKQMSGHFHVTKKMC